MFFKKMAPFLLKLFLLYAGCAILTFCVVQWCWLRIAPLPWIVAKYHNEVSGNEPAAYQTLFIGNSTIFSGVVFNDLENSASLSHANMSIPESYFQLQRFFASGNSTERVLLVAPFFKPTVAGYLNAFYSGSLELSEILSLVSKAKMQKGSMFKNENYFSMVMRLLLHRVYFIGSFDPYIKNILYPDHYAISKKTMRLLHKGNGYLPMERYRKLVMESGYNTRVRSTEEVQERSLRPVFTLHPMERLYLKKILKMVKDKNVSFSFLFPPISGINMMNLPKTFLYQYYSQLNKIAEEEGIEITYFNFQDRDWDGHFVDNTHLDEEGARFWTGLIRERLKALRSQ